MRFLRNLREVPCEVFSRRRVAASRSMFAQETGVSAWPWMDGGAHDGLGEAEAKVGNHATSVER
jgi:hypothetical protein